MVKSYETSDATKQAAMASQHMGLDYADNRGCNSVSEECCQGVREAPLDSADNRV